MRDIESIRVWSVLFGLVTKTKEVHTYAGSLKAVSYNILGMPIFRQYNS